MKNIKLFFLSAILISSALARADHCDRQESVLLALEKAFKKPCSEWTDSQVASFRNYLDLSNTGITEIRARDFKGLTSLRGLDLSRNQIRTLKAGVFADLMSVASLNLSWNEIVHIEAGAFRGISRRASLFLSDNLLADFNPTMLDGIIELSTLDLGGNKIRSLGVHTFQGMTFHKLILSGNPLSALYTQEFGQVTVRYFYATGCGLRRIDRDFFQNAVTQPRTPDHKYGGIGLARNQLREILPGQFAGVIAYYEGIDLSENEIDRIHPAAFQGIDTVDKIDLSLNRLTDLPDRAFHEMGLNWAVISLRSNRLQNLNPLAFEPGPAQRLKAVDMTGNPLVEDDFELLDSQLGNAFRFN